MIEGNTLYDTLKKYETIFPFINKQIKDGKLYCTCGAFIPSIHPTFAVILDKEQKVICYPCDYKRTGINPYKEAIEEAEKKKKELEEKRIEHENIKQKKQKEKEDAIKEKEQKQLAKQKAQDDNNRQAKLF
jgi:hypothetical protein